MYNSDERINNHYLLRVLLGTNNHYLLLVPVITNNHYLHLISLRINSFNFRLKVLYQVCHQQNS